MNSIERSNCCAAGADCFISKPLFRSVVYGTFLKLEEHHESHPVKDAGISFLHQRVLLVEDNALNLEIAQSLLEEYGFEVDSAENGKIAVEGFSKRPHNHYLAVLMDIRMPVMDSLEATRAIRALDRPDAASVPIIAMSANAFDEDRAQAFQAGVSQYLVKLLEIEVLLRGLGGLSKEKTVEDTEGKQ